MPFPAMRISFLFTLFITLLMAGCGHQPSPVTTPAPAPTAVTLDRSRQMADTLNLTPSQRGTFNSIYDDYEAQLRSLRATLFEAVEAYQRNPEDPQAADLLVERLLSWEASRVRLKDKTSEHIRDALSPAIAARFIILETRHHAEDEITISLLLESGAD